MNRSVLIVDEDDNFKVNSNPGFIQELDFTIKTILNTSQSSFIEAKVDSYIHYRLQGKEIIKYFGYIVDNNFYWESYLIAELN